MLPIKRIDRNTNVLNDIDEVSNTSLRLVTRPRDRGQTPRDGGSDESLRRSNSRIGRARMTAMTHRHFPGT